MEIKYRKIMVFIVLALTVFSLFGTNASVSAQGGGTDLYFPLFYHAR